MLFQGGEQTTQVKEVKVDVSGRKIHIWKDIEKNPQMVTNVFRKTDVVMFRCNWFAEFGSV